MALQGPQKAAMLLMHLDPPMAAELLGSAKPEIITEVATELAYLAQSDRGKGIAIDAMPPELLGMLVGCKQERSGDAFVKETLEILLGSDKSRGVLQEVNERVRMRDPFKHLRAVEVPEIAACLVGESPQVVSVVLSELPPKKSAELMEMLDEERRSATIRCMTIGQEVSSEAKLRVATVVQSRLEERRGRSEETQVDPDVVRQQQLRRVAVLLRSMAIEIRKGLIEILSQQDTEAVETIEGLMVIWEDIPQIADRALQETLRTADSRKLALAMIDADEQTSKKIRDNISERAESMLDEEASLLSEPKPDEIQQAREEILTSLREMNASGDLEFEGE